ncbi:piRNA biogenesis protein EXD1 [Gouania willdenowi]|uniref:3'-5' exonuclease domain-containing protein n=1 Tax=Gouania willdenowi TaxID=441366 RepID=A0A8C5DCV9_GOUWI|nr:piRNA biogenesis protein EXD1 [Gouania willdenowi]
MSLDEVHLTNIFNGKRIKLTLTSGTTYSGFVLRINSNKTLVLDDVRNSNGGKFPGAKMFFRHEIVNVEFDFDENGKLGNPFKETETNIKCLSWYDGDDGGEEEFINYVVIDEFHEKFGPALMHIKKQHVIGVGVEGLEIFKNGRLCWLQIATKKMVYLFDILRLGARAFKNGLSMILASKDILKVIHDCRALAGCLTAQFGVNLTNVFDTQVADVMCFHSKTGGFLPSRVISLQKALSIHLKMPISQLSSLQIESQLPKEEKDIWYLRPTPLPLLKAMALSVIHLQPLRLVLLDSLMTDYVALVDLYLHSSHYQPDELEHVNMESVFELPDELKQLQQMHHERHEWAAGHYPVTEQGLLDRFTVQPQPPSNSSPAVEDKSKTHPTSFECKLEKLSSPSSHQSNISVTQPTDIPSWDTDVSSWDFPAPLNLAAQDSVLGAQAGPEKGGDQKLSLHLSSSTPQVHLPQKTLWDDYPPIDLCGKREDIIPNLQRFPLSLVPSFRA